MIKWLIHMKSLVGALTLLVFCMSIIDCMTAEIEVVRKSLIGWEVCIYIYIYIWTYICKTRQLILSE